MYNKDKNENLSNIDDDNDNIFNNNQMNEENIVRDENQKENTDFLYLIYNTLLK